MVAATMEIVSCWFLSSAILIITTEAALVSGEGSSPFTMVTTVRRL